MVIDRHVPLDGPSNFRDFGGYESRNGGRVKRGELYRSDHLADLTPADLAALAPHGIRLICDLRRDHERDMNPTAWTGDSAPEVLHLPLFSERRDSVMTLIANEPGGRSDPAKARAGMVELYERMVTEEESLGNIRVIFDKVLHAPSRPLLIHCSGGKDRTGVSAALILTALGVPGDAVFEDFLMTNALYDIEERVRTRGAQLITVAEGEEEWSEEALVPIFSVEAGYLEAAFAAGKEKFGSVDALLREGVGLTDAEREKLKDELLA